MFVCVSCNSPIQQLTYEERPGVMVVSRCPRCDASCDPYVGQGSVLSCLHLGLLKPGAWRHELVNVVEADSASCPVSETQLQHQRGWGRWLLCCLVEGYALSLRHHQCLATTATTRAGREGDSVSSSASLFMETASSSRSAAAPQWLYAERGWGNVAGILSVEMAMRLQTPPFLAFFQMMTPLVLDTVQWTAYIMAEAAFGVLCAWWSASALQGISHAGTERSGGGWKPWLRATRLAQYLKALLCIYLVWPTPVSWLWWLDGAFVLWHVAAAQALAEKRFLVVAATWLAARVAFQQLIGLQLWPLAFVLECRE